MSAYFLGDPADDDDGEGVEMEADPPGFWSDFKFRDLLYAMALVVGASWVGHGLLQGDATHFDKLDAASVEHDRRITALEQNTQRIVETLNDLSTGIKLSNQRLCFVAVQLGAKLPSGAGACP